MRLRELFPPMWQVIPEGRVGDAEVEHFEVSPRASQLTAFGGARHYVPPGKYARLKIRGETVMSDTEYEHRTNYRVVREARGTVLIGGLGLGMILVPILKNPAVKRVIVVESHQGVIDLVEDPLRQFVGPRASRKLTVLLGDIRTGDPATLKAYGPFDALWFDIWGDTSTDALTEMAALTRRLMRLRRDRTAFMDCWDRDYLRYRKRQMAGWVA